MCWPSRGEKVKLPVQIVMVASDCHESLGGLGASGKTSRTLVGTGRATPPRELAQLHSDFLADEVSFLQEKGLVP